MDIDITGARILISKPEWGGFMLTETVDRHASVGACLSIHDRAS